MRTLFTLCLLITWCISKAQVVIDSFPAAATAEKLFIPSDACQGVMSNGHPYCLGWNVAYPKANFPVQFVRVDLLTKKVTTKRIDSAQYYAGQIWVTCYDVQGQLYAATMYGKGAGHVYQLNLKDPSDIVIKDLGIPFPNHTVYSMATGRDGKVYFGTMGDSRVGYYDPVTDKTATYKVIDIYQNYILSIAGDSSWIYSQVGQKDSIFIYATRKADGAQFKLSSNPNNTRYGLTVKNGYCTVAQNYASYGNPAGAYYLINGAFSAKQPAWQASNTHANDLFLPYEVTTVPITGIHYNTSVFDPITNYLYFTHGYNKAPPVTDSVLVPCDSVITGAGGPVFTFDDNNIYYKAAIQYGNIYRYNIATGINTNVGYSAANIYAAVTDKKSQGVFMGGYPSGSLLYYSVNQPWTANKIIKGRKAALDDKSNPKLLTYFRTYSKPPAGFHHTFSIAYDNSDSILVCTGDVIRTANTVGIGAYNINRDSAYGYDYMQHPGLVYSGAPVAYKKWMLFPSASPSPTVTAAIFFYNARTNVYDDSITLNGFADYGVVFVNRDTLYGFTKTKGYKLNLVTKKLIDTFAYTPNGSPQIFVTSAGQLITSIPVPPSFYKPVITMPAYNILYEHNGILYATNRQNQLVRIRGLVPANTKSKPGNQLKRAKKQVT